MFFLFHQWIFFQANFIVCLSQFWWWPYRKVDGSRNKIKKKTWLLMKNMARCSGLKRIKLDHYIHYCSSQMHIIFLFFHGNGPFSCLFFGSILFGKRIALSPQLPFFRLKKKKDQFHHHKSQLKIVTKHKLSFIKAYFTWIWSIRLRSSTGKSIV